MSQEENKAVFEKRTWNKGDGFPGARDLNRIEGGIELAHDRLKAIEELEPGSQEPRVITINTDDLVERIKQISKLEPGAKVADLVVAFNGLVDALTGIESTEGADNGEGAD